MVTTTFAWQTLYSISGQSTPPGPLDRLQQHSNILGRGCLFMCWYQGGMFTIILASTMTQNPQTSQKYLSELPHFFAVFGQNKISCCNITFSDTRITFLSPKDFLRQHKISCHKNSKKVFTFKERQFLSKEKAWVAVEKIHFLWQEINSCTGLHKIICNINKTTRSGTIFLWQKKYL